MNWWKFIMNWEDVEVNRLSDFRKWPVVRPKTLRDTTKSCWSSRYLCLYSTIIVYILQYGTLCWNRLYMNRLRTVGHNLSKLRYGLWVGFCEEGHEQGFESCGMWRVFGWCTLDLSKGYLRFHLHLDHEDAARDTSKRRMVLTKGQR